MPTNQRIKRGKLTRGLALLLAALAGAHGATTTAAAATAQPQSGTTELVVYERVQGKRDLRVRYGLDGRALELTASGDGTSSGRVVISRDGRALMSASFAADGSAVIRDHRGGVYTAEMLERDPSLAQRFDRDVLVSLHPEVLPLLLGIPDPGDPAAGPAAACLTWPTAAICAAWAVGSWFAACHDYGCVWSDGSYHCFFENTCH